MTATRRRRAEGRAKPPPGSRPPVARAIVLGALAFAAFAANLRHMGSGDTIPARLLPFSILREGNLDLNEFPWIRSHGFAAYFVREDSAGRVWSTYPIVAALLATPVAAPFVWWQRSASISDDAVAFRLATVATERLAAAAIAAAAVGVLYFAACLVAAPGVALVVALAFAFSTNTWAVSSQALWQHGPAELGLSALSACLLLPARRRRLFAAGCWAAFAVAARPSMIVFALAALAFVWRERRSMLPEFLAAPVVVGAALLAYNLRVAGKIAGGYNAGEKLSWPSPVRLAGLLFSPSRGLLVYTPAAAVALPGVLAARREPHSWISYLAWGAGGYLAFMSAYVNWWAGHCWGPRYLTDMLPAVALLAAAGAVRIRWKPVPAILAGLAIAWGVAAQAVGVYCDLHTWETHPVLLEQKPDRVWDWSDPQILRALADGWHGNDLGPLLRQTIGEAEQALVRPLEERDLDGAIAVASPLPHVFPSGGKVAVDLRIENHGRQAWPAFSSFGPFAVGTVQFWRCDGKLQEGVGGFVPLPRNIGPGRQDLVRLRLEVPTAPGPCDLEIRISQLTGYSWGVVGNASLRLAAPVAGKR